MAQGSSNPTFDLKKVAGTAVSTNTGNADAGTQRIVLASNQPVLQIGDNGGSITVDGTVSLSAETTKVIGTVNISSGQSITVTQSTGTNLRTVIDSGTLTNLTQFNGQAIAMGTGVRSAGTLRVTVATDDVVPVSQSGTWNVNLNAGTNAIGKLAANDGVDIGDVTINNASIAVTGTFWQATQPISAASLPLPTGAATSANQTTEITALQLLDDVVVADNAAFTDGTTKVSMAGFVYDDTAGTALTENDAAAARIDSKRAQVAVIEDATTRGRYATVTAANALKVDASGTVELGPTSLAALESITVTIPGTVDLGTVSLTALETITVTQSTPASLTTLSYGTATTASPTYTDATNNPLSLTTAGELRVSLTTALPAGSNTIGTVNAVQSGTWTVQPGNTANTTAWLTRPAEFLGTATALGALNANISQALQGNAGIAATITASSSPVGVTLTPQVSFDGGTNWVAARFFDLTTETIASTLTSFTVGASYSIIATNGVTHARVVATAWTSGSVTVRLSATNAHGIVNLKSTAINDTAAGTYLQVIGAVGSTSAPTAVTSGNAVRLWATTSGALNIADGGGSITVDGTVAATQSGTWSNRVTDGTNTAAVKAASTAAATTDPALVVAISPNNTVAATQSGTWSNRVTDGTNTAAVKAASTAAAATDPALVVAISPNNTVAVSDGGSTLSIDDNGGSITVDGTVAATQSGTWSNRVTDGTNTAAVKAASTAAVAADPALVVAISPNNTVAVSDGGGSITVDGTVAATQSGTWTVQPGNTANTTAWLIRRSEALGTATALAAVSATVSQALLGNSGAAAVITAISAPTGITLAPQVSFDGGTNWITTQFLNTTNETLTSSLTSFAVGATYSIVVSDGATHVRVIATTWTSGSVTVRLSTSNANGVVNLKSTAIVDASPGSYLQVTGAIGSTSAPTAVTSGNAVRLWATTAGALNIADGGSTISIDDNGGSITVDGTVAATQSGVWSNRITDGTNTAAVKAATTAAVAADPALVVAVSPNNTVSTNVSQVNGVTALTGNGVTGTGSLRVTIASDNTAFSVNANQAGTWSNRVTDGTNTAAVKAASTAAVAADPALVVAISPNNTLNLAADDVHDAAAGTTAVMNGGYAYGVAVADNTLPAVSANGDAARLLMNKNGAVIVAHLPEATQAYAPTNATTTAYAASLVVKASAGTLYMINGFNSSTSSQFIHVYDATALPADGTVPKIVFIVSGSSNFSLDLGNYGRYFASGIVVGNSSTGPTKTIGSANCWFDVQYK